MRADAFFAERFNARLGDGPSDPPRASVDVFGNPVDAVWIDTGDSTGYYAFRDDSGTLRENLLIDLATKQYAVSDSLVVNPLMDATPYVIATGAQNARVWADPDSLNPSSRSVVIGPSVPLRPPPLPASSWIDNAPAQSASGGMRPGRMPAPSVQPDGNVIEPDRAAIASDVNAPVFNWRLLLLALPFIFN